MPMDMDKPLPPLPPQMPGPSQPPPPHQHELCPSCGQGIRTYDEIPCGNPQFYTYLCFSCQMNVCGHCVVEIPIPEGIVKANRELFGIKYNLGEVVTTHQCTFCVQRERGFS